MARINGKTIGGQKLIWDGGFNILKVSDYDMFGKGLMIQSDISYSIANKTKG